jgi:hypothetical protein
VLGHRVIPAVKSSLAARRDPIGAVAGERIVEEILAQLEVPL